MRFFNRKSITLLHLRLMQGIVRRQHRIGTVGRHLCKDGIEIVRRSRLKRDKRHVKERRCFQQLLHDRGA